VAIPPTLKNGVADVGLLVVVVLGVVLM
jgi:hypothetical protein